MTVTRVPKFDRTPLVRESSVQGLILDSKTPVTGGTGVARTYRGVVASQAVMLALVTVNVGDWVERSDLANQIFELTTAGQATLANWTAYPAGGVMTFAALTDASTATLPTTNTPLANALAAKAPLASPALTGAPTVPTATPLTNTTQAASTAYADAAVAVVAPNAPITVTAGFTFAKAAHANRRIGYNSASAGTATFDNTAGFTNDDGFRLMQEGAGAVTLAASVVTFSNPKAYSLVTGGAGTFIDAEWDPTIGQLVITGVGSAGGATLGANTFTGVQTLPVGTMALPSLTWGANPNTGFYQKSAYETYFTLGGADAHHFHSNGSFNVLTVGRGLAVKEGAGCMQGAVTLVAGAATVTGMANVGVNERIFLTSQVDGGTPGFVRVSSRVAGTSFTITSSSATDTSTIGYQIFQPAA